MRTLVLNNEQFEFVKKAMLDNNKAFNAIRSDDISYYTGEAKTYAELADISDRIVDLMNYE